MAKWKIHPELDDGKSSSGNEVSLAVLTRSGQEHPYMHQVKYGQVENAKKGDGESIKEPVSVCSKLYV